MNYIAKISNSALLLCTVFTLTSAFAEPYRVGIPLPLTGYDQIYGEELRRGYEMGKEMLKADDVQLIFENDECDPPKGVTAIKKLVDVDKVQAIGGIFCNSVLFAAAPILNRSGVPVLTSGANPGDKIGIGKKIFRLFPADHLGVVPLLKYISKSHKRLCMLTETDAFSELISRTVKVEWKKLGSDFSLYSEDVDIGNKDYRSVLLRLIQNRCDGLFINTAGDDGYITAFKQAMDIKISVPMFAYYMPGSTVVQKELGSSLNGVIYATLPTRDEIVSDTGKEFMKLYKSRYGDFQVAVPIALLAFESLRLMVEAKSAGVPLDVFLHNRTVKDGAIGEYSFDEDGALRGIKFKVVRYEDGKEIAID